MHQSYQMHECTDIQVYIESSIPTVFFNNNSLANLEMVFFLKNIELYIRNFSQFSNIIYIFTIHDSNFIKIYLKLLKSKNVIVYQFYIYILLR